MTGDDELHLELVDDPAPPEPGAALLARVVVRGRQRQMRRRAVAAAVVLSIVVALIGGGVAVAQRGNSHPEIAIRPPISSTTLPVGAAVRRRADAHGWAYSLTLESSVVPVGGAINVALRIENRSATLTHISNCELGQVVVYAPDAPRPAVYAARCPDPALPFPAGESRSFGAGETAPEVPGDYLVVIDPMPARPVPAALLTPFHVRVVAVTGPPTLPSTGEPAPTIAVSPPVSREPLTSVSGATTTVPTHGVGQREADANGLHFTLTLTTPVVEVGGKVGMVLRIEDRRGREGLLGACELGKISISVDAASAPSPNGAAPGCPDIAILLAPGGSHAFAATARAPDVPGSYLVVAHPTTPHAPASLFRPLVLRVVPVSP